MRRKSLAPLRVGSNSRFASLPILHSSSHWGTMLWFILKGQGMSERRNQISILGLLGFMTLSGLAMLVVPWVVDNWTWGLQAVFLTPILMLYVFSWAVLMLLAPALVAILPGVAPAVPAVRWCSAVIVAAAESLFVVSWMSPDSVLLLMLMLATFFGVWWAASFILREYFEAV